VFDGIHKATGGIPRRINSVCDRLLLTGFLGGRTLITVADVAEVVRELEQENAVPAGRAAMRYAVASAANPDMPGGMAGALLDVDLGAVQMGAQELDALSQQIAGLTADQRGDQLQRLERSLLRLERINVQTLAMLTKLVEAVKKPDPPDT
jgi:hypothetical protein